MLRLLYHIQNWLQKWFSPVMSPKQLARWERTRLKGKSSYVWRLTLFFGIWMFVTTDYLLPALFHQNSAAAPNSVASALVNLTIYCVTGYVFSRWSWSDSEKRYLRSKDRQFGS